MGRGGGCSCAPCASSSLLEVAANPAARKLRGMHGQQAMGNIIPSFHFKSDVDELKRLIHPAMVSTNLAVQQCANITPAESQAWAEFFKAWTAFHDEETPNLLGVGRRYDDAVSYRDQLAAWQEQLRAKCTVPGSVPAKSIETDASSISSAVRWGAVAVIAVAVVYGVRTVLP